MGLVGRNAQDKPSTRVILLDEPSLRNGEGERKQLGGGAMASDVTDTEARLAEFTASVVRRDPGTHRDAAAAATEQGEEPERGRPVVIIGGVGYQVDPSVPGGGQPRHVPDDLRRLVEVELHSLDPSLLASHARSIAAGSPPERGSRPR